MKRAPGADLPASPAELPPTRMRYIRIASTPHSFIASNGLATFPRLLLILNRSIVQCPCVRMCFGGGKSSARRIAGRYRAWKLCYQVQCQHFPEFCGSTES